MPRPEPRGADRRIATKQLRFKTKDEKAIAEDAAKICRTILQKKGWSANSSGSIRPVYGKGVIGLDSTVDYVIYQNKGTKPFLMHWVEGRIVPISDADGTHFVRGKDVGKPGWVTLPGGVRKWRDQKWRHPGLKPQHFMEDALTKAIKNAKPTLFKRLVDVLMGRDHD
jgi:hypothetical protein